MNQYTVGISAPEISTHAQELGNSSWVGLNRIEHLGPIAETQFSHCLS